MFQIRKDIILTREIDKEDAIHAAWQTVDGLRWMLLALLEFPNQIEASQLVMLYNAADDAAETLAAVKKWEATRRP